MLSQEILDLVKSDSNISAFNFDDFAKSKTGTDLDNFYNWTEEQIKDYLKELIKRLFDSQPSKIYQAVKISNPAMKKLIHFDWEELGKRVLIMTSPNNENEFVVFMVYGKELKNSDKLIPIKEK